MIKKRELAEKLELISNHIHELNEKMISDGLDYDEIQLLQHYRRTYHEMEYKCIEDERNNKEEMNRAILLPDDYIDWIRRYNSIGEIR